MQNGEKQCRCEICNKFYSQKGGHKTDVCTLEISVTNVTVAVAVSAEKNNVDRHQWTHTGEKHFECDVCNNYFTQRGSCDFVVISILKITF